MLSNCLFVLVLFFSFYGIAQPTDTLLQKNNQTKIKELYERLGSLEQEPKSDLKNDYETKINVLLDSIVKLNKTIQSLNKLTYMVQFYLSKKEVEVSKQFKGLDDVAFYKENDDYKYTIGHFEDFEKAQQQRKKMIDLGYKDAFVLMIQNGKRIN